MENRANNHPLSSLDFSESDVTYNLRIERMSSMMKFEKAVLAHQTPNQFSRIQPICSFLQNWFSSPLLAIHPVCEHLKTTQASICSIEHTELLSATVFVAFALCSRHGQNLRKTASGAR
ncbi:hypothetical protein [Limnobacter alexandrii]|uniref:hypothetical protein n=1 Tax=Limnobacter alexandrii TaxID=2570352 RepID=UPI0011099423|nr:hypothetical protein [Limnobacter alexandrii]